MNSGLPSITGRVYFDVNGSTLQRFDAFEGEAYEPIAIQMRSADSRALDACVYCVRAEFAS